MAITLKIGIQTHCLGSPLRNALDTAALIGAEGVEIDLRTELPYGELSRSAIREIRKLLDDHRLRVAAVRFPTRRGYGDQHELDRRLIATQAAMAAAGELGARVLVGHTGEIPDDVESEEYAVLVNSLATLARHGDRVGVSFAAVAQGRPEPLAAMLRDTPEGSVGATLRPADLLAEGVSPADAVSQLGGRILHVHASDAVRDLGQGRTVPVALGRGSVEWPDVLSRLEEHDYRGWICVEHQETPADPADLDNAIAYLRAL